VVKPLKAGNRVSMSWRFLHRRWFRFSGAGVREPPKKVSYCKGIESRYAVERIYSVCSSDMSQKMGGNVWSEERAGGRAGSRGGWKE
jgi:hypothetical protein